MPHIFEETTGHWPLSTVMHQVKRDAVLLMLLMVLFQCSALSDALVILWPLWCSRQRCSLTVCLPVKMFISCLSIKVKGNFHMQPWRRAKDASRRTSAIARDATEKNISMSTKALLVHECMQSWSAFSIFTKSTQLLAYSLAHCLGQP